MFSTVELTCAAMSASASMASSVKASVDALGRQQRHVLLDQAGLRLRQDAAEILAGSGFSSTRIGSRPCSSGSRSDGLA